MTRKPAEEVVTELLTEEDWKTILSQKLKKLHRVVLELFKENGNRPLSISTIYNMLSEASLIDRARDHIWLDSISVTLKRKGLSYRFRAADPKGAAGYFHNPYRLVKVKSSNKGS